MCVESSVTIDSKKNLSMSVKAFVVAALLLSSTALLASGDDDCDDGSKNPSKLSFKNIIITDSTAALHPRICVEFS